MTAPSGRVHFEVREGRLQGLRIQRLLAQAAEIAQFAAIDYDETEGDYAIERGRVRIDELRLDGAAVHLVAAGDVGARDVELIISPRIGPSLMPLLPGNLLEGLLRTASDLVALPIVVSVKGPWERLRVAVQPASPSLLQGRFGEIVELLSPPEEETAPTPPPNAPEIRSTR